ncbi:Rhs family protein [Minicystis rosea]|nr:Rhs family protein [Minicystis rosea]
MRSKFGVGVVGASVMAIAAFGGCGGGGETGPGGGGSGGATSSSSSTTVNVSSSIASSSSGTGGAGGNHSFETALPLDIDTSFDSDLFPAGTVDYYSFEGKAGQAVDIFVQAQAIVSGAEFDPTYIDTIVTLFDASKNQIAENNDGVPRNSNDSELVTVLPADGTYYVRVQECWSWAKTPKSTCQGTADKDSTSYTVGVVAIDPTTDGNIENAETGNDPASATPMTYAKANSGSYYLSLAYGTFKDATDVDVFSISVPPDAVQLAADERGLVSFWLLPAGTSADGSTTPTGRMYLVDPDDLTKSIAEINGVDWQTAPRMWPAVDLTKDYLLFVEHPAMAAGANDFYIFLHGSSPSNPVESNEAGNDDPSTPEQPLDVPDTSGAHHYYIDGDLINGASDVDHWSVPVGTSTQIAVSCSSQRGGSGLRGFQIDVFDPVSKDAVAYVKETAKSDAYTGYQTITPGATSLIVKMSAASQDPNVTSSFYHCGIHLQ